VSALYVYALLGDGPPPDPGAGLGAEPLRVLRVGDLGAAVGEMAERPALSEAALRAHDAVVRRLAGAVDAILPVRFGALLPEGALTDALATRAVELRRALALVAGREQMTLRVFGETAAPEAPAVPSGEGAGPGARYLDERRRQWRRAQDTPEIAPLRPLLAELVRAERVQRHDAAPLLASVYHLVDRGAAAAYLAAVARGAAALTPVRVTAAGPWPPYAFAPEALVYPQGGHE
jgi:Gas vesicle synthesis protein GvpL/GvpF